MSQRWIAIRYLQGSLFVENSNYRQNIERIRVCSGLLLLESLVVEVIGVERAVVESRNCCACISINISATVCSSCSNAASAGACGGGARDFPTEALSTVLEARRTKYVTTQALPTTSMIQKQKHKLARRLSCRTRPKMLRKESRNARTLPRSAILRAPLSIIACVSFFGPVLTMRDRVHANMHVWNSPKNVS